MARKKSIQKSARDFRAAADAVMTFLTTASRDRSDGNVTWLHNYGIIKLYREFESLMLDCLVGAINNDSSAVSSTTGIRFPKHMTDEVCEYLIVGTGYFDFKGRDGLIKTLKKFVPEAHYLVTTVKKAKYKEPLERLSALRNFAAHESAVSKRSALDAVGAQRMSSSGSWLKVQGRMTALVDRLKELADQIEVAAPY